ncbi:hypothetical protein [Jannaschia seohaensis]|uniref:hypothetical protein n=1 Tax=Jannaschia seohaensis TaxID=475081 RepID=UPI000D6C25BB|nr:hypothetical protein [Jannaschia seohaensis]
MDNDGSHQAEMFALQVRRQVSGGPISVASAELSRPGFKHRLTFGRDDGLSAILQPQLASYIHTLLNDEIEHGPRVLARPDETLALPGLMLGRMRAIISKPIAGQWQATVRFRYFIGGVQNAFAAKTYFDRPALEHREEIGMRALEDVAVPLLNMAMTAQTWPDSADTARSSGKMVTALASIEAHATELEFYAGLLRRYIAECGPKRMAELGTFDDPVRRMMQMSEPPVPALRPRS